MTYNIEIFKSDSYQKILKEVLKFRYPELSYKEALKKESEYLNQCLYSWYCNYEQYVVGGVAETECRIGVRATYDYLRSGYIRGTGARTLSEIYSNFGRPITICEIIRIMSNYKMVSDDNFDGFVDFIAHSAGYTISKNCVLWFEWNLFNFLHEQSQEIIDKIAELF